MKRSIEVVFSPEGEINIEAMNFQGADCGKATAFLEKALGTITTTRKKPEFNQQAPAQRKAIR